MSNRTKLWLVMLIAVVSSLILFICLSILVGAIWANGYNLEKLNSISQETLHLIEKQGAFDKNNLQPVLDSVHSRNPDLRLEWMDSEGTVIYDTSGEMGRYSLNQLMDRIVDMPNNLWAANELITLVYSLNHNTRTYYLLLSLPSEAMKEGQYFFYARSSNVIYTLILPFVIAALVPYILSLWFFSSINRRIANLIRALNHVNFQSDVIVLEDKNKDEIGQLTQHYNEMAHRIKRQANEIEQFENRRKLLLSHLSHDLRTPLTIILGYAETIRAGAYKDEDELQSGAKIILQRSRYMDNLLDQLLDISRQEDDLFEIHFAPNNLSEMVRKIVADYLLTLDGLDYTIEIDIPERDMVIDFNPPLIERALRNLLDNAIQYGNEGHFLGIRLTEEEESVCFTVKDRGRGIAPDDFERVFERFYRVDGGRKGTGFGLGLSIVQEIVQSHQGSVNLSSTPYTETLFHVRLPKRQIG